MRSRLAAARAPVAAGAAGLRVFMTTDCVGGIWPYALDLADGLLSRGVAVTLAMLGPPPGERQLAEAAAIPGLVLLPTGLTLEWTADTPAEVRAASALLSGLARDAGADIIHLNNPAFAAEPVLSDVLPLLVMCHSCVATWWAATCGGPLPEDLAWRRDLTRDGYLAADVLVAPSAAFALATAEAYGLKTPPLVIHNGRTAAQAAAPMGPAAPFAFTAGRLWDSGKNLAVLDRAAARLGAPFLAAGPLQGPNGATIRLSHLRTLGRLDSDGVAGHLAARPVFASAARYEPFGLAVLEAAQAGCALVLADLPGFRELWGDAACYVDPDDDSGFATAISALLRDTLRRRQRGLAAQARAARYSVDAMVDATLAAYRTLAPNALAKARE